MAKKKVTKEEQLEAAKKVLLGKAPFESIPVDDDTEEEVQQEEVKKPIVIPELDELKAILNRSTKETPEEETAKKEVDEGVKQQAATADTYGKSVNDLPTRTDVFAHKKFGEKVMDKILPHTQKFGQTVLKPIFDWFGPKLKRVWKFIKKWAWAIPSFTIMTAAIVLGIFAVLTFNSQPASTHKANIDNAITITVDDPYYYDHDIILNGHDETAASQDKEVVPVSGHNGEVHQDEIYTVQDGDTLWQIAETVYGSAYGWEKLYNDNKDLLVKDDARNAGQPGHWIHVGQQLVVNK